MKGICFVLSFVISISASSQLSFKELSCILSEIQKDNSSKNSSKKSTFHDVRLYAKDKLEPFFLKSDTIFLMECYFVETGVFHTTIWNRTDTIHYSYHNRVLKQSNESIFSRNAIQLVGHWDLEAIRKEERKYDEYADRIYSARIINREREVGVSTTTFKFLAF